MGVDYRVAILPKRRTFVPTNGRFADFVEGLRTSRWTRSVEGRGRQILHRSVPMDSDIAVRRGGPLPTPFSEAVVEGIRRPDAVDPVEDELRVQLCVDRGDGFGDDELLPRILMVDEEHPLGFSLDVFLARDFVEQWANNVADGPVTCVCGANLAYDVMVRGQPFWAAVDSNHVHARCPACDRPYDPSSHAVVHVVRDTGYERGFARPRSTEHAPLVSHVGVVIDFDKDWPVLPEGQSLEIDPELVASCEAAFGEPFEAVHLFT